jgi:hypothetical protein
VSALKLNDVEIDPAKIESVVFDKAGAQIKAKGVTVSSGTAAELTVPQNTLMVRLKDGTGFSARGPEAKEALNLLKKLRDEQQLNFPVTINESK